MKVQDNSNYKNFKGTENISMGLDLENTSSIMTLLRNSIYSDPIESIVREVFSNAIDAQVRINSNASIEIDVQWDESKYLLSIRDFGASMDKNTIERIYSKMGRSDKNSTNLEQGGFGLGAKVPLSYTDHFFIETYTIENDINIYRKWVQYIDVTKVGIISLLEEDTLPVNFKQGTKITVGFNKKDYPKLISSLDFYLTYTKSNYTVLNPDILSELKLQTANYNYYGSTWAYKFSNQDAVIGGALAVISGIPYKLDMKIVSEFIKNAGPDLDYIIKVHRPYYIKQNENKRRFQLFVSLLTTSVFEIKIDIGSVDLSASRESLQYTDKTSTHLYIQLYKMFCEFYKDVYLNVVNNPSPFKAVDALYNNFSQKFVSHYSNELYWSNKYQIDLNQCSFSISSYRLSEYKLYKMDTAFSQKTQSREDVIKNISYHSSYLQMRGSRYIICIQDSKYKSYSAYVRYYLSTNILNKKELYNTYVICVSEDDVPRLQPWLVESCLIVRMTDLINSYKENVFPVKTTKMSSDLFKSLLLNITVKRSKAVGISKYCKEVICAKEPADVCFYISKDELNALSSKLDDDVVVKQFIVNLFSYFKTKDLNGAIYITEKVSRNYNHKNWISLFDVIIKDAKSFNMNNAPFWSKEVENASINLFKYAFINKHLPIFKRFNKTEVSKTGYYSYISDVYSTAYKYLNENKLLISLVNLLNTEVYDMNKRLNHNYALPFTKFNVPKCVEQECEQFYTFCHDYLNLLPFIKCYNIKSGGYLELDIKQKDYLVYINLMESKLNLNKKINSEEVSLKNHTSEFGALCNNLVLSHT